MDTKLVLWITCKINAQCAFERDFKVSQRHGERGFEYLSSTYSLYKYLKQSKIYIIRYGWQPIGGSDTTARMIRQGNENVHTDYPVDVASWYFCFLGMPFGTQLPTSRPSSGRK